MISCLLAGLFFAPLLRAEEGGSGHYLPGSMASFIDAVPPSETFLLRYNMIYYDGGVGRDQPLPIAGLQTVGAEATSWAHGLTILWRPPIEIGEKWSYAMSATIPFVWMDVTADVTVAGLTVRRTSSTNGLGDIVLMPLMFNRNVNPDLNINFRVAAYAPTGSYEVGRLANTGKNFWTIEPTVALMYLGQKNGREASLFFGADFNQENPDTDYQTGTELHLDTTFAQHFPFAGGLSGIGLNAYWYEQVTGDSGAGATYGDFEGKTVGLGPVVSHVFKADGVDFVAELKWLHEFETKRRMEGDTVWFKFVAKF